MPARARLVPAAKINTNTDKRRMDFMIFLQSLGFSRTRLGHKVNPETTENYMGIPGVLQEHRHSISEFGKYLKIGWFVQNVNFYRQIILQKWIMGEASYEYHGLELDLVERCTLAQRGRHASGQVLYRYALNSFHYQRRISENGKDAGLGASSQAGESGPFWESWRLAEVVPQPVW